jgi:MoxR-like ATPase
MKAKVTLLSVDGWKAGYKEEGQTAYLLSYNKVWDNDPEKKAEWKANRGMAGFFCVENLGKVESGDDMFAVVKRSHTNVDYFVAGEKTEKKVITKEEVESIADEITETAKEEESAQLSDAGRAFLNLVGAREGIQYIVNNSVVKSESKEITLKVQRTKVEVTENGETKEIIIGEQKIVVKADENPALVRAIKRLAVRSNVYLCGPAGCGKTYFADTAAKALGLTLYSDSNLRDAFEVKGYSDVNGKFVETSFYRAFANGGLYFIEEMDYSDQNALTTLNRALANGYFDFPVVGRVFAHKDFVCLAAGNTIGKGATEGFEGASKLSDANLDRFRVIEVTYDDNVERGFDAVNKNGKFEFIHALRAAAEKAEVRITLSYRAYIAMNEDEMLEVEDSFILKESIFKGMPKDDISILVGAYSGDKSNKWYRAMCNLVK